MLGLVIAGLITGAAADPSALVKTPEPQGGTVAGSRQHGLGSAIVEILVEQRVWPAADPEGLDPSCAVSSYA